MLFSCYNVPSYSLPLNAIFPSIFTLFRFLFAKTFIKVLFPAPELPMMARTSPLRAHPETLSSMIFFDFSLDFTPKFDHFNTLLLNFNFKPYCVLVYKNLGSLFGVSTCCIIRFLCMTMVRRLWQTLKALFDSLCITMCYYLNEIMTPIVRFYCSTNLKVVLDCTRFIRPN